MKKITMLSFGVLILASLNIYSQQKGFGVGIIAGEPTGISAKYWTSETNAFHLGLGYSFTSSNSLLDFYSDYVFHNSDIIKTKENLVVYYGPGARLKIQKDNARLGLRGVIGIIWVPQDAPIDLFVELAPILDIIPGTKFDFAGAVGARYFFK